MKIWISVVALGMAAGLWAQDPQGGTEPAPEYGGPSVLSRSPGPSVTNRLENVRFRPFLSLTGIFDSGMMAPSVDSEGRLTKSDVYGGELGFGVNGYRSFKRTVVGLDYRGYYRHYSRKTFYDGTDQALALGVSHQLSRRLVFNVREAAGIVNRGFGNTYAYWLIDPTFANLPQDQLFDNRIMYLSSTADLTYQKSARWSFNMGGDQMVHRYRSAALYGVSVYRGRTDAVYRYSRFGTIGVTYSFQHFSYTKAFGASDIHSPGLVYSLQLNRRWQAKAQVAGVRVETLGAARVQLDPAVAAIIGQTQGIQAIYRVNYLPNFEFNLDRTGRRNSFGINYQRGVNPGNGVYLVSATEMVGVTGRYTATRRLSFGTNAGYSSYRSLAITLGKYKSFSGGGGITYQLARYLHLVCDINARRYQIDSSTPGYTNFNRLLYRATVGLAWAPGDMPLSIF